MTLVPAPPAPPLRLSARPVARHAAELARQPRPAAPVGGGDADRSRGPLSVCLVSGSDLVHHGLAGLLAPFPDDVVMDRSSSAGTRDSSSDVVLYDLATSTPHLWAAARSIPATCVVLLAWSPDWRKSGQGDLLAADGLVAARLGGRDLAQALREIVDRAATPQTCWAFQAAGLSRRESEVLLHIARGESNQQIAATIYVSINSLKGYIRSCYGKIRVTTRTEAVLWAIQHRFPA